MAAALVAVGSVALLGISALAIDIGNAWQTRREMVTSTDAAALAATQDFITGTNGCLTTAPDYVNRNNGFATMTGCSHTIRTASTPGRVTVDAQTTVDFFFAPVLGINSTTVNSSTTVNYDSAARIDGGLRPYGLCTDIVTNLGATPGDGIVYRIFYGKDAQPNACNSNDNVPGNWGILDFDGGSNPCPDIQDWTEFGYPGSVEIGDWVEGDPGSFSPCVATELQHLVDNVDSFGLPIFGPYNDGGGGNAEFQIVDFRLVRLHGFETNGPQEDRYLDIEFLDGVVQGGQGGPTGSGANVIGICAVDGVDIATHCG